MALLAVTRRSVFEDFRFIKSATTEQIAAAILRAAGLKWELDQLTEESRMKFVKMAPAQKTMAVRQWDRSRQWIVFINSPWSQVLIEVK